VAAISKSTKENKMEEQYHDFLIELEEDESRSDESWGEIGTCLNCGRTNFTCEGEDSCIGL